MIWFTSLMWGLLFNLRIGIIWFVWAFIGLASSAKPQTPTILAYSPPDAALISRSEVVLSCFVQRVARIGGRVSDVLILKGLHLLVLVMRPCMFRTRKTKRKTYKPQAGIQQIRVIAHRAKALRRARLGVSNFQHLWATSRGEQQFEFHHELQWGSLNLGIGPWKVGLCRFKYRDVPWICHQKQLCLCDLPRWMAISKNLPFAMIYNEKCARVSFWLWTL